MFEVGGEVLFDEGLGQQFFAFGQAVFEAVCFGVNASSVVLVSGVQALRSKSRGRMYFMVGLSTGRLNIWFQTVSVVYR